MVLRNRRSGRRRIRSGASQRRFTWVVTAIPPVSFSIGQGRVFELLTPVRPASDITNEVYQSMTNPTIVAIYGHVTVFADRPLNCGVSDPTNLAYAWGIYKDTDAVAAATALYPFNLGRSNVWMMHHSGYLLIPGQNDCDGFQLTYGLNDLQYRRYELSHRRYKRKLDPQNDSLVFSAECAAAPFSSSEPGGEMVLTAYFRMLLLE